MIEVHGPTYKYDGEVLTKPEVIFIQDHHYDEEEHCFHVQKLLEASACDPKLHTLVFDHVNHDDALKDYNSVNIPIFLAVESQEFINQNIKLDWNNKTSIFNFSINKPRVHRKLLLEEIVRLKLKNYTHSLPWKFNDVNNIPVTDYKFGPEVTMNQGIRNGNFTNAETYNKLLKHTVYEPSCISVIAEPVFYEREAFVTEKTFMAIMGGTFPIWFGGWKIPESMRYLGFDVFDDIIDHSYETLEDPYERCVNALLYNIDLFSNLEHLNKLIESNKKRLEHNVNLIKSNVCLKECLHQADIQPDPIKQALIKIIPSFRHNMFISYNRLENDHEILGSTEHFSKK